ncbi:MAG: hypothetical protein LLG04_09980 [Parachlamydia sp.]|nr:hypothetical protein [Parachlamydia sp.]
MVSATRAATAHSHGSVRRSEVRKSPDGHRVRDLAKARISPHRGFADLHPEWKEYPSKGQNIPPWIKKRDNTQTEVERTLFRHSSGREYEIGIWATGDHHNHPSLKEIRSNLLPNLQQALKQQRKYISVTAIKAAMVVTGRLPIYKVVHRSLSESFEFHACVSSQPKEELDGVYQAFEQTVKRVVDRIEEKIRLKEQEDKAHIDHWGYTQQKGWAAVAHLNNQNQEMAQASDEITVTEVEDAEFPDPPTFSYPDYMKNVTVVKIYPKIFKHKTGKLYEVAVLAYPQKNVLETMVELRRKDSSLEAAVEKLGESHAKLLSTALELQHKPYTFRAAEAASQVAGRAPLSKALCGEINLESFVCRQPVKEVEEVQQAFEKQKKEVIAKYKFVSIDLFERYLNYHPNPLVGPAPAYPFEGMMLWKERITETERLLEWSEDESGLYNRDLKWLIEWENKKLSKL